MKERKRKEEHEDGGVGKGDRIPHPTPKKGQSFHLGCYCNVEMLVDSLIAPNYY